MNYLFGKSQNYVKFDGSNTIVKSKNICNIHFAMKI